MNTTYGLRELTKEECQEILKKRALKKAKELYPNVYNGFEADISIKADFFSGDKKTYIVKMKRDMTDIVSGNPIYFPDWTFLKFV